MGAPVRPNMLNMPKSASAVGKLFRKTKFSPFTTALTTVLDDMAVKILPRSGLELHRCLQMTAHARCLIMSHVGQCHSSQGYQQRRQLTQKFSGLSVDGQS